MDKKALQDAFTAIVAQMAATDTPFPPGFKLFYRVDEHTDRRGTGISVEAFLTRQAALLDDNDEKDNFDSFGGGGKYHWYHRDFHILEAGVSRIELENATLPSRDQAAACAMTT